MASLVGKVKELSGSAIAINESGKKRVVSLNDELFLGDTVKTLDNTSCIKISTSDEQIITIIGQESLTLDKSVVSSESFGDESVVCDAVSQETLLAFMNLTKNKPNDLKNSDILDKEII